MRRHTDPTPIRVSPFGIWIRLGELPDTRRVFGWVPFGGSLQL